MYVFTTYNNRLRSLLDTSFPDVSKNVEAQQDKQKKILHKFEVYEMVYAMDFSGSK